MGPEALRLIRLTGALTWLLVATPPAVEGIDVPSEFLAWLGGMVLFGRCSRGRPAGWDGPARLCSPRSPANRPAWSS